MSPQELILFLSNEDKTERKKLFEIFNQTDLWMLSNNFKLCDELLSIFDIKIYSDTIVLGFITATFRGKNKIISWKTIRDKVEEHFNAKYGIKETINMMRGLD